VKKFRKPGYFQFCDLDPLHPHELEISTATSEVVGGLAFLTLSLCLPLKEVAPAISVKPLSYIFG
jgi:hypothetical protein